MFSKISRTFPSSRRFLSQVAKNTPPPAQEKDATEKILKVVNRTILASIIGAAGFATYLHFQPDSEISKNFYKTSFYYNLNGIYNNIFDFSESMAIATQKSLLPPFESGSYYGQIPPGVPPRPVLVLDLERTLIGSVYDANEGWKHAKRPGLDKFLQGLVQYYEIIIISENDLGIVSPIYQAIDPDNYAAKFGFTACESRDQKYYKVLYNINRDPRTVIFIDDNPESVSLCKDNAIIIKPFENVNNKHDRELTNLLSFLQGIVHEGIDDFPALFKRLGTHDAHELAIDYKMRVKKHKDLEEAKKNKGLGSLIRGNKSLVTDEDDDLNPTSILSLKEIVGESLTTNSVQDQSLLPSTSQQAVFGSGSTRKSREKQEKALNSTRKKGSLINSLSDLDNEKAELAQKKKEKMNEIHTKKMMEKMAEEENQKNNE